MSYTSSNLTTKCCICMDLHEEVYDYIGNPCCWECFFKQMSRSTYDKDVEDLSGEELEELEDICNDLNN